MKTILTDYYGFYPWAMLFLSARCFSRVFHDFSQGDSVMVGLDVLAGIGFAYLAIRRWSQIRQAKSEGRDHTILRVTEPGN